MRDCSVCARKRNKLYVGECMVLTIGLSGMFDLCTFGSSYSLGERGFVGFNVDLVLLRMLLFSTRIIVFCAIILVESLSSFLCTLSERRFYMPSHITTQHKNSLQSIHLYTELSPSLTKNIYRQNSIT